MPRRQPGTVNDEPATYSATYPARAVKALPYAALHAVRLQIGCNLDAVRMQFGCGSDAVRMRSGCGPDAVRMQSGCSPDAVSLRLMQLCIQAGYSSDAVQKLSRHSRCGSVCGPNTVMNASECAPDAAQSGSARSPNTIRMRTCGGFYGKNSFSVIFSERKLQK